MNVWVQVLLSKEGDAQERAVEFHWTAEAYVGETLHSGDRLAIAARIDAPAYLYVVAYSGKPAQPSTLLFPDQAERRLEKGETVRVPGAGRFISLDDRPGVEVLYVVASDRPMEPALRKRLGLEKGRAREPPPVGDNPKDRPLDTVRLRANAEGIALGCLHLPHAARSPKAE